MEWEEIEPEETVTVDAKAAVQDLLKRGKWILVLTLLSEDAATVSDLVRRTGMVRSTISRILSRLRRYGLLESSKGIDARTTYYWLSKDGNRVLREVASRVRRRLKLCTRDKVENGWVLDPHCASKALAKLSRNDPRVNEALLALANVKQDSDKLILSIY